jgi:hypothetical protein
MNTYNLTWQREPCLLSSKQAGMTTFQGGEDIAPLGIEHTLKMANERPNYITKNSRKFDNFLGDACDDVYSRLVGDMKRYHD